LGVIGGRLENTGQSGQWSADMRRYPPIILALTDLLAILAYVAGFEPSYAQAAALGIKLFLIPLFLRDDSIVVQQIVPIFVLYCLCFVSLASSQASGYLPIVQNVAFLAHLALTLLLVADEIPAYLRWLARLIGASAVLYVLFWFFGQIISVWGRAWYFNGLHPNLGTEIAAMGALCGVLSLRYREYLLITAAPLVSAFIMQGRSAIVAIVLATGLRSVHEIFLSFRSRRTQIYVLLAIPAGIATLYWSFPILVQAMMFDDIHRGADTGFVGRADRWAFAWQTFLSRPLTGRGLGSYADLDMESPHDFFLYGLAEMGLLSVPLFLMIGYMYVKAFRIHGWKVVSIAPVVVLMIMNDRFMNLNPYPFLLWVLLFALSTRPSPAGAPEPQSWERLWAGRDDRRRYADIVASRNPSANKI
jgi:O-antigen ligase